MADDLRDEVAKAIYLWWDASGAPEPFERLSFDRREDYREAADAVLAVAEPRIRAETLRWAANKVDAGPTSPLPPSVITALLREYADAASTGEGDRG